MRRTKTMITYNSSFVSQLEKHRVQHLTNIIHCNGNPVVKTYIAGGALLREDSKDIDVLICTERFNAGMYFDENSNIDDDGYFTDEYDHAIIIEQMHALDWVDEIEFFFQYDNEEADSGKDIIIKVYVEDGRDIDLLIGSESWKKKDSFGCAHALNVREYMQKYFPMSVQCIALDLDDGRVYASDVWHLGVKYNSIYYIRQDASSSDYKKKYSLYYPDVGFIST